MSKRKKPSGENASAKPSAPADESVESKAPAPQPVLPADLSPPGEDGPPPPESQHERWLKYGANVLLTTIVVLALAGIAVWASAGTTTMTEKLHARTDLSSDSSNQLKPQTIQLIKDLPSDVTLVSLYPKLKKEEAAAKGADTYSRVLDILNEYKKNSPKIQVQAIDPVNNPGDLGNWLAELKKKYGANTDKYDKFLNVEAPEAIKDIKKRSEAEVNDLSSLFVRVRFAQRQTQELAQDLLYLGEQSPTLAMIVYPAIAPFGPGFQAMDDYAQSISGGLELFKRFPTNLENLLAEANKQMHESAIPDYTLAVQIIRSGTSQSVGLGFVRRTEGLSQLSTGCEELLEELKRLNEDKGTPEPLQQYAKTATPRVTELKAKVDALLKTASDLGPLKLDEIRKKVLPPKEGQPPRPAIVVLGNDDVRVIDDFSLWKSGEATGLMGRASDKPKLRFAGEQQVTTAILSLSQPKKQKVVFLTSVGPVTDSRRPLSEIVERLRAFNFDVSDAGSDQQPNPMNPRPTPPPMPIDPDAIVIALSIGEGRGPGPRLKKHLDAGGSALVLVDMMGDDMKDALKDWGISVRTDAVISHQKIEASGSANPSDFIEAARRQNFIFVLNNFGTHPITTPLKSLDAAMIFMPVVSKIGGVSGVTVTPIIPIPQEPPSWGETDLSSIRRDPDDPRRPADPKFDAGTDISPPLYAGAVAEKGKGRLVVIGSVGSFTNNILRMNDPKLAEAKPPTLVARFPANGELLTNSVFWLAHNEKMIALSPSAMDTARIADLPPGQLGFLRIGLVMVILPALALVAGVTVWMRRRA
jgi:hypothetical protein